jgi:hypothetical protein
MKDVLIIASPTMISPFQPTHAACGRKCSLPKDLTPELAESSAGTVLCRRPSAACGISALASAFALE